MEPGKEARGKKGKEAGKEEKGKKEVKTGKKRMSWMS
jgi:hypothetical protein